MGKYTQPLQVIFQEMLVVMATFVFILIIALLCEIDSSNQSDSVNDLSLNDYTSDGEVAQLFYSAKTIKKSTPFVGWQNRRTNEVFFLSIRKTNSPLGFCTSNQIEKFTDDRNRFVIGQVGHHPDIQSVFRRTNEIIQESRLKYGEYPNLDKICRDLSIFLTKGFYPVNRNDVVSRPLAVSMVLSEYDISTDRAKMILLENSGLSRDSSFVTLGMVSNVAHDKLHNLVNDEDSDVKSLINIDSEMQIRKAIEILSEEFCSDADLEDGCIFFECARVNRFGVATSGTLPLLKGRTLNIFATAQKSL